MLTSTRFIDKYETGNYVISPLFIASVARASIRRMNAGQLFSPTPTNA